MDAGRIFASAFFISGFCIPFSSLFALTERENMRTYFIYVPETKERVEVASDVYYEYYRPIWRTQKRMKSRGLCKCPKRELWKCVGDCIDCSHYTGEVSLNTDYIQGTSIAQEADDIEESVIHSIMLEQLIRELDELDPESRKICDFIMQGMSDTEAAKVLNIPRTTFQYRKKKVLDYLRSKLE